MELKELYKPLKEVSIGEDTDVEDLKKMVMILNEIINKQYQIIIDYKNINIRLKNKLVFVEDRLKESENYNKLLNIILEKVKGNPIKAWHFIYSLKKKISQYNK